MAVDFGLLGNPVNPLQVLQSLAMGQQQVQQRAQMEQEAQQRQQQQQMQQRQFALQEQKFGFDQQQAMGKQNDERHELGVKLLNSVTDEASYVRARQIAISRGIQEAAQLPETYDATAQQAVAVMKQEYAALNPAKQEADPSLIRSLQAAGIDPMSPEGRKIIIDNLNPPQFTAFGNSLIQTRGNGVNNGPSPPLFDRVLGAEGGTDRNGKFLTSPKGAIGPAQVMPGTAPEAARLAGLPFDNERYRSDPEYNKALGSAYLNAQLQKYGGDEALAAAAYNAGPGAVDAAIKRGGQDNWLQFLPRETRDYVAKVAGGASQGAGPRVVATKPEAGTDMKGLRKAEADLRKQFDSLPEVKEFKNVRTAFNQIRAVAKKPSAQNDIALIFSYMKMLDPGSVVREGEFATAQNAAGIPDRIRNAFNAAQNGERLNRQQRSEMVKSAADIYASQRGTYNAVAEQYRGYAKDYDVNPDRIARRYVRDADKQGGQQQVSSTIRRIR